MPSSTSSSEHAVSERPGFVRLTASDRPGVAQPVPERDIPDRPWGGIFWAALVLFLLLMVAWEMHWRAFGAIPGYRNSDGEWVAQRRRIDEGEGDATVLIGSSRTLFDIQLPAWESLAAERPIQLALEGTSSVPMLEDLAKDVNFHGRLLVGVAPDLFFSGFAYRGKALDLYAKQGPSQRSGNWLSQTFIEPYFAFYEPDFALNTVLRRQPWWPVRAGVPPNLRVRKLMVQTSIDRNSRMWNKLVTDADYRAIARATWAENFTEPPPPDMDTPEKLQKKIDEQIDRAVAAVRTLRGRGVQVVFLRLPSVGPYHDFEQKVFPRVKTWDVLLQRTGAPGIHFEDHPQLQGYNLPEWSHLAGPDADRLTAQLVPLVEAEFAALSAGRANQQGAASGVSVPPQPVQ